MHMWTAEAALNHLLLLYSNQETQLTSSLLTNNTHSTARAMCFLNVIPQTSNYTLSLYIIQTVKL